MGYDSKHTDIKNPKDGYNLIADQYGKYHKHLDGFDKGFFQRILPRNLNGINIIDLGAGDGRIWKIFKEKEINKYTACDVSENILKKHPSAKNIEKVICNLEEELPFNDNEYQLALSFFVVEHINNIEGFFQNVYRILAPGGQRIIGHFFQRREWLWKKDKELFKIALYNYRIQDIEKLAKESYFSIDSFPIVENGRTIGFILSLKKD